MFESFFPRPEQFFPSVLIWSLLSALFWNTSIHDLALYLFGVADLAADGALVLPLFWRVFSALVFFGGSVAAFLFFWSRDPEGPRSRQVFVIIMGGLWLALTFMMWRYSGDDFAKALGLYQPPDVDPVIGIGHFITPDFIAFYLYFLLITGIFALFWRIYAPHPWQRWSIGGSALILFTTYYGVQVAVAINNWRRPFFDLVQTALTPGNEVNVWELYGYLVTFAGIAFFAVAIFTTIRFFTSHYIFRWRTAMNDYYLSYWTKLRHIEGASQRIQEDTMRFATIMENLGVDIVEAVMTLFAFLPILLGLSIYVASLPIIGDVPGALLWAAILWAAFGTIFLAGVGIKLPGLQFRNQRVEAAFRKELVYGEDDDERADPPTMTELFSNVRRNYFRLYFHYMYFNVARGFYVQADNIYGFWILTPTIAAGMITFGILQQILTAFGQVSSSFQLVVNAWPTIVELMSIFKRLKAFEAVLDDKPLPSIDQEYLNKKADR